MVLGWILSGGILSAAAAYVAISMLAARRLLRPYRRLPQMEPAELGLRYEDVWLQSRGDNVNIAAWHIPAKNASRAIIFAHGIGACRGSEFTIPSLELAAELVERGFTVLMLDLRGHGESDPAAMSYGMHERRDILGAVDWLLARDYAPGSIGVLGVSMGAVAAIGAASEEKAIGALVLDSVYPEFYSFMRRHYQRISKLPALFFLGFMLVTEHLIGEILASHQPADMLARMRRPPTLVIHGENDKLVPVGQARHMAKTGDVGLLVMSKAGHMEAYAAEPRTYTRKLIQFFGSALTLQDEPASMLRWLEVGDLAHSYRDA